jgi:hypothetical protein
VARYKALDAALARRMQADPSLQGMGTTLTVAYSLGLDLGRDVEEIELLDEELRLRSLAGPGGTEQRDVQHFRLRCSFVSGVSADRRLQGGRAR